jgi:hypothetical protein
MNVALTKLVGWVGFALVLLCWPLNWLLPGLRTHILFFPLWLGYILVVQALALRRNGASLLTRSPGGFFMLFVISAPMWWLFEFINRRTRNWEYLGGESFSDLEYVLFASLNFSTVIPAVLSTTELIRTCRWVDRFAHGPRVPMTSRNCVAAFLTGCAMLSLFLVWPRYFYPFVWTSLFFLLEPVNVWLAKDSLWAQWQHGDWRMVVTLCVGVLICGFFWEMWNYYSYPKWVYHIPFFGFWRVFEMPLLGYLGYLPFALELYAIVQLVRRRRQTTVPCQT